MGCCSLTVEEGKMLQYTQKLQRIRAVLSKFICWLSLSLAATETPGACCHWECHPKQFPAFHVLASWIPHQPFISFYFTFNFIFFCLLKHLSRDSPQSVRGAVLLLMLRYSWERGVPLHNMPSDMKTVTFDNEGWIIFFIMQSTWSI